MSHSIAIISAEGPNRELPFEEAVDRMRASANTVVVDFRDHAAYVVGRRLLDNLPRLIAQAKDNRRASRIEAMVATLLDVDPFDSIEAQIDADNAEMRANFLALHPLLDSATVHARSGHRSKNPAQTAAGWKKAGRIFALPYRGRDGFPAFQFDADGQPLPLLREVLAAFPADFSPWQRAFWLVAVSDELGGGVPLELLRRGDSRAVESAREAGRLPIG